MSDITLKVGDETYHFGRELQLQCNTNVGWRVAIGLIHAVGGVSPYAVFNWQEPENDKPPAPD